MYPLFSGLCGYVFGTNSAGNLDPSAIGVANPKFLKNAGMIDTWNKDGLIRSSVDSSISKDLFLKGKTAYFFTGPWNLSDIRKTPGLKIKISRVPDDRGHRLQVGAVPRRPGLHGHEVRRRRTASTASRRTWSRTT